MLKSEEVLTRRNGIDGEPADGIAFHAASGGPWRDTRHDLDRGADEGFTGKAVADESTDIRLRSQHGRRQRPERKYDPNRMTTH